MRRRGSSRARLARRVVIAAVLFVAASIGRAAAQSATTGEPRLAVSVGPEWVGRADVGGQNATLTSNGSASPYQLFGTESTLTGGPGPAASLSLRLGRGLWAEFGGRYQSALLETRIANDVEAAPTTVSEGIQQVRLEAGVLWLPERLRLTRRLRLAATAGGGFLRQLHSTNTLGENGRSYYAGGGLVIDLPQRAGGTFEQSGIRVEARATMLDGGVAFGDGLHTAPSAWVALFLRF